jgi:hypothetical protein
MAENDYQETLNKARGLFKAMGCETFNNQSH